MGELFDQLIIELKNLAKSLKIEEVKEEPHHSEPIQEPKGRVEQVMVGSREYSPQEKSGTEFLYINRIEAPVMTTQNDIWGWGRQWRNMEGRII